MFPSDFFGDTRTSDPHQSVIHPKVNVKSGIKTTSCRNEFSPKKSHVASDSTSAISRDNEYDDNIKLPSIQKIFNASSAKDFAFPFKNMTEKKMSREMEYNVSRSNRISGGHIVRRTQFSPNKICFKKYNPSTDDNDYSPNQEKFFSESKSMISRDGKQPDSDYSINKSKSVCRYLHSELNYDDGYGTDRHSLKKHSAMLSLCKSDSGENSIEFDPLSTDAFDQLCKLADESETLPDIFARSKTLLETTFRYKREETSTSNTDRTRDEYVGFDEILKADKKFNSPLRTIDHQSSKAKELRAVPFSLSTQNPEQCGLETAYFGN